MTPLTPDDLERMRREHVMRHSDACDVCGWLWPCDAVRLLDEVERLRKVVGNAALGFGALGYLTIADELRRKVVN